MLEGKARKGWNIRELGGFKGESSGMRCFQGPFPWSFFSSLRLLSVVCSFFFSVAVLNSTSYFLHHGHVDRIGSDRIINRYLLT
jgi:hypothetical protein